MFILKQAGSWRYCQDPYCLSACMVRCTIWWCSSNV